MKKQNGITLIALVITIIVLLILAAVSITALTDEDKGVVTKAKQAASRTEDASKKEDEDIKDLVEYAENDGEEPLEALPVGTVVTEQNRTLIGTKAGYKNPIIPVGFKAVNDGASWEISGNEIAGWNDGLVIEDENGNEFVWVPVDGTNVPYEKWCVGYDDEWIVGHEADTPSGIDEDTQIEKYQGFWIGRYEAGRTNLATVSATTNNVNTGVELLIQKGAQTWNYITYDNAKIVSEKYMSNKYVQSGLPTGTQWDTLMKWLENSGYDVETDSTAWGNYANSAQITINGRYTTNGTTWSTGSYTTPASYGCYYLGTGIAERTKAKNIYDLAGNFREWTSEKNRGADVLEEYTDYMLRSIGGYILGDESPACARIPGEKPVGTANVQDTFRVVLFVK